MPCLPFAKLRSVYNISEHHNPHISFCPLPTPKKGLYICKTLHNVVPRLETIDAGGGWEPGDLVEGYTLQTYRGYVGGVTYQI